tara:strand:+ start:757 stop:1428 length:672 start_codon:yes stop_codon:yes gene_type:complete
MSEDILNEDLEDKSIEELTQILENISSVVNDYSGIQRSTDEIQNDLNELNQVVDHYKNLNGGTFNVTNPPLFGVMKNVTKFNNRSNNADPIYAHVGDSGFDIRASLKDPVILKPLERKLISTGLSFELSPNTELQIRPRSGMALKHGITVLNTPGTVDEGYRGDVGVILVNLSNEKYTVNDGDRIAQGVIMNVIGQNISDLVNSNNLSETKRGGDGFGSTGKK